MLQTKINNNSYETFKDHMRGRLLHVHKNMIYNKVL